MMTFKDEVTLGDPKIDESIYALAARINFNRHKEEGASHSFLRVERQRSFYRLIDSDGLEVALRWRATVSPDADYFDEA